MIPVTFFENERSRYHTVTRRYRWGSHHYAHACAARAFDVRLLHAHAPPFSYHSLPPSHETCSYYSFPFFLFLPFSGLATRLTYCASRHARQLSTGVHERGIRL